ncbi:hypothetical protein HOY82DRAFT_534882 [Tuber indicum]|nr:hypothetical protein HOY82DRAFT_534882 [Tuber indicum]
MICFSARPAFRYASFYLARCRIATLYTPSKKLLELFGQDQCSQPSSKPYQQRNNLLTLGTPLEAQCIQRYQDQLEDFGNESYESYQLKDILLTENINRMKLLGSLGIRKALEHIVYHAILDQKIPSCSCNGIQQGLDRLADHEDFRTIFGMEAEARSLDVDTIMNSVSDLYDNHSDGHGLCRQRRQLIICGDDCCSRRVVALVAFMKMQSQWSHPLPWKLISSKAKNVISEEDEVSETFGFDVEGDYTDW